MNRFRRPWAFVAAAWCALALVDHSSALGETLGIKEFNDKLRQWKMEERPPSTLPITVEGRLSIYDKDRLRFKNCDVLFTSQRELPSLTRSPANVNVEVEGKVRADKVSGHYTFEIFSARETSSDKDRFHELQRKIRDDSPQKWYELGHWAQTRGTFYKDDELLTHAEEAFGRGLQLERKAVARDNPEALLELAEKAAAHRLPFAKRQEIEHEAYYLMAERSRKKGDKVLKELAGQIAQQLRGANEPIRWLRPADLLKRYETEPLETYADAGADTRLLLHRLLYTEVLLRTIIPKLAPDGSNGFEIADQIDQLGDNIPERHQIAEEYRDRELAARAAELENLTKKQMLELAERYRERKQPREADRLIESWLTLRLRALDPDDTEGTLQLSDEYRRLLKRNDLADRMLIDAWKRNLKAADLSERIQQAGYRLFEGNWISESDFKEIPEGRMEPSIRAGKVEIGMNPGQVRRARAGSPDSQARTVTAGQVSEIWTYQLSDGSRLFVRLTKRTGQNDFAVVDISQFPAR